MRGKSAYYRISFVKTLIKYQSLIILGLVILFIFAGNYVFDWLVSPWIDAGWLRWLYKHETIIQFAPEAWLGLLGLVLGTLIIVISVASQSTPKLIDLYTDDQTSLFYIWYIVVGSVHNMFLQLYGSVKENAYFEEMVTSMLFNTYFMLPFALMVAVPYVLYILRYTKTSNVIDKIFEKNHRHIRQIADHARAKHLSNQRLIGDYQFDLFESLNQMDDLLEYVSFKEPKDDIIHKMSESIQNYIRIKPTIRKHAPEFFEISSRVASDVSFKTMTGQFADMQRHQTFYEQKGFRLLGNAYIKLIEEDEFDLASVCAYELSECGRVAIEQKDESLIDVVLIRFNTLIRFGIKHGLKQGEARNLYNAIFHYSGFIQHLINAKSTQFIQKSSTFLNRYVNEIYRHSQKKQSFIFLVDAFTWEFKRILIELDRKGLDMGLQREILDSFLRIDNLSDPVRDASSERQFKSGVRMLQVALALYYIGAGNEALTRVIIEDILQDHKKMERGALRKALHSTCEDLKRQEATFWEDTDRGNSNLYFSHDIKHVGAFLELFEEYL